MRQGSIVATVTCRRKKGKSVISNTPEARVHTREMSATVSASVSPSSVILPVPLSPLPRILRRCRRARAFVPLLSAPPRKEAPPVRESRRHLPDARFSARIVWGARSARSSVPPPAPARLPVSAPLLLPARPLSRPSCVATGFKMLPSSAMTAIREMATGAHRTASQSSGSAVSHRLHDPQVP